jgi:hypothetical protein
MTIWKRERNHFNYYVTNERKQPHIYVEALGTPSASTEKVLKDHGFKFDYSKCMYAAAQTNDLRLFVAHDLDKLFNYDIQIYFNSEAKKELFAPDIQEIKDICYHFKIYKCYIDILNKDLFKICKPGSKSLLFTYNTNSKTIDVFNRNKLQESYIYNNCKIVKMIVEKDAPKKKKKATPALTEQQKINKMLEAFPF